MYLLRRTLEVSPTWHPTRHQSICALRATYQCQAAEPCCANHPVLPPVSVPPPLLLPPCHRLGLHPLPPLPPCCSATRRQGQTAPQQHRNRCEPQSRARARCISFCDVHTVYEVSIFTGLELLSTSEVRYSGVEYTHWALKKSVPSFRSSLPKKHWTLERFTQRVVDTRKAALAEYINNILSCDEALDVPAVRSLLRLDGALAAATPPPTAGAPSPNRPSLTLHAIGAPSSVSGAAGADVEERLHKISSAADTPKRRSASAAASSSPTPRSSSTRWSRRSHFWRVIARPLYAVSAALGRAWSWACSGFSRPSSPAHASSSSPPGTPASSPSSSSLAAPPSIVPPASTGPKTLGGRTHKSPALQRVVSGA